MALGFWCLVLHAHLPYVRRPDATRPLEEDWLFEAVTESYVPLLRVVDGLAAEGVPVRLTLGLTPTLLEMLADAPLVARCRDYLARLTALADDELARAPRERPERLHVARFNASHLREVRRSFVEEYGSDLIGVVRRQRAEGRVALLASAATHGLLPLLGGVPQAVTAQIELGVAAARRHLAFEPAGFWLPECAFEPGLDARLRRAGLRYSFLEAHGVEEARPRPSAGAFAPILTPAGTALLARDPDTSRKVWSAEEGYPGHGEYREFYRDLGFELSEERLERHLGRPERRNVGIKYHRITGRGVDLGEKALYDPERALAQARDDARRFVEQLAGRVERLHAQLGRPPVVVSPYDAELFGHWWFEGPAFLGAVFRELALVRDVVEPATAEEVLERNPELEIVEPPLSSWGEGGYLGVWLDPANDWIYPRLDGAARRMVRLARQHSAPAPLARRALAQAARELLLAQASDWAFMLKKETAADYAARRVDEHLERFARLAAALEGGGLEAAEAELARLEALDAIFPELDYRVYT